MLMVMENAAPLVPSADATLFAPGEVPGVLVDVERGVCRWFFGCDGRAVALVRHPLLLGVPVCKRCLTLTLNQVEPTARPFLVAAALVAAPQGDSGTTLTPGEAIAALDQEFYRQYAHSMDTTESLDPMEQARLVPDTTPRNAGGHYIGCECAGCHPYDDEPDDRCRCGHPECGAC